MEPMKIGIMGGTFNPIHHGHLILAQLAYEQVGLNTVLFMPSKNPPHKQMMEIVSDEHRLRMVELAIEDNEAFQISTIELEREGMTYTADTLIQLTNEYPEKTFYFIIGADSFFQFQSWMSPQIIADKCILVVAQRDAYKTDELKIQQKKLEEQYHVKSIIIDMPNIDISSHALRERILEGKSIRYYIPEKVLEYIKEHDIYCSGEKNIHNEKYVLDDDMTHCEDDNECEDESLYLSKLRNEMKLHLKKSRYEHVLSVEEVAADLACIYGCDEVTARIAGILHDCAKNMPEEDQIAYCKNYNIPISLEEEETPNVLHAKVGERVARVEYQIQNEDILNAIYFHTTGRPHMSLLEKIIYVADYIEPKRKPLPRMDEVREVIYSGHIDQGLLMIVDDVIQYLQDKNSYIDPVSLETQEYYRILCADVENNSIHTK